MIFKIALVTLLLVIIASLALAFRAMVNDGPESTRTVRALSWRVGLSVAAFVLLMAAAAMGLIESNAVVVGG